jgi:uncharacterized protein DUF6527
MKLLDLEPEFIRYETKQEPVNFCVGDPLTWRERGCPTESKISPVRYRHPVETLAEAQGIFFLCPVCFTKNKGPVGTHLCEVTFSGREVKDEDGVHGVDGKPTRWNVTGTGFIDLSTTPSILLIGGCGWHGYITNGEVT